MAAFFHDCKILFNGIEILGIRREREQRVARLLDQVSSLGGFVKGRVIHDQDRGWSQLFEEMVFQPDIEPLRIRRPLKQHRGQQMRAPFGCQQTRAGSRIPTPLSSNPVPSARPSSPSRGGALKSTFIHIHQLISLLGQMKGTELLKIQGTLAGIAFSVPQSFFYR